MLILANSWHLQSRVRLYLSSILFSHPIEFNPIELILFSQRKFLLKWDCGDSHLLRPSLFLFHPLIFFFKIFSLFSDGSSLLASFESVPNGTGTLFLSSMAFLLDHLSQLHWLTDCPVPTGKTPEEVLKKYLQKVRHPPDEVSTKRLWWGSSSWSHISTVSSVLVCQILLGTQVVWAGIVAPEGRATVNPEPLLMKLNLPKSNSLNLGKTVG